MPARPLASTFLRTSHASRLARSLAGLALAALSSTLATAQVPELVFVQISDSQPVNGVDFARFQLVLDTVAAGGTPGALLPRRPDVVLFPGDLVDDDSQIDQWTEATDALANTLTAGGIPFFAVPGNHDQEVLGLERYEHFVASAEVWDFESTWFTGHNGLSAAPGWRGLRFIGLNNSNGDSNVISATDLAEVEARVAAASAAGENVFLVAHHEHDGNGVVPLQNALGNPDVVAYMRGHVNAPQVRAGLSGVSNPNVFEFNSNSIISDGAVIYCEVFTDRVEAYVLELASAPAALPPPVVVPLVHPLTPVTPSAPIASFEADVTSGAAPLEVDFTDTSSGPATTWSWDFGDGAGSDLRNPTHVYTSPGVYTVTLVASNVTGLDTVVRTDLITVAPPAPVLAFVAVEDALVKSSSPTRNYGSLSSLRVRYGTVGYQSYVKFDVAGLSSAPIQTATLRLWVTDASDDGGRVHVVSNAWSEGDITFASAPAITGAPFADLGGVPSGAAVDVDVTAAVTTEGTYSFGLLNSSSDSAIFSSREGVQPPELILVLGAPAPPVAGLAATPTSGPVPHQVHFTDLSTGLPTTWLWDFGDGSSSTTRDPVHTFTSAGTYTVSLTVTNTSGSDVFIAPGLVDVSAPVLPSAAFDALPTSGSAPLEVTFSDASTGNPTGWSWDFGDGNVSSERNPVHTYVAQGTYDVTLTVSTGAGSDQRIRPGLVTVGPPQSTLVFTASADARVKSTRADANYGSSDFLRVRAGTVTYESYLKFDVTGLGGQPVSSAMLRLFVTDGSGDSGALYTTTSSWIESVIHWGNAPGALGQPVAQLGATTAGTWVELDVAAAVTGVGAASFVVAGGSSNSTFFSSREGLQSPELVVVTASAIPLQAGFSADVTSGSAPLSVSFTDESSGVPTSWSWDFGDGTTSTAREPVHVYGVPGTYTVRLEVQDLAGVDVLTRVDYIVVSAAPTTLVVAAAADAHVKSTNLNTNYGAADHVRARGGGTAYTGYLRFDVAGIGAQTVHSATLRLFVVDESRAGGIFRETSTAWTETGLTFGNAPPLTGPVLADLGPVALGTWIEVDVTSSVAGDGPLAFGLESASTDSILYSSREGVAPPELVIVLGP